METTFPQDEVMNLVNEVLRLTEPKEVNQETDQPMEVEDAKPPDDSARTEDATNTEDPMNILDQRDSEEEPLDTQMENEDDEPILEIPTPQPLQQLFAVEKSFKLAYETYAKDFLRRPTGSLFSKAVFAEYGLELSCRSAGTYSCHMTCSTKGCSMYLIWDNTFEVEEAHWNHNHDWDRLHPRDSLAVRYNRQDAKTTSESEATSQVNNAQSNRAPPKYRPRPLYSPRTLSGFQPASPSKPKTRTFNFFESEIPPSPPRISSSSKGAGAVTYIKQGGYDTPLAIKEHFGVGKRVKKHPQYSAKHSSSKSFLQYIFAQHGMRLAHQGIGVFRCGEYRKGDCRMLIALGQDSVIRRAEWRHNHRVVDSPLTNYLATTFPNASTKSTKKVDTKPVISSIKTVPRLGSIAQGRLSTPVPPSPGESSAKTSVVIPPLPLRRPRRDSSPERPLAQSLPSPPETTAGEGNEKPPVIKDMKDKLFLGALKLDTEVLPQEEYDDNLRIYCRLQKVFEGFSYHLLIGLDEERILKTFEKLAPELNVGIGYCIALQIERVRKGEVKL